MPWIVVFIPSDSLKTIDQLVVANACVTVAAEVFDIPNTYVAAQVHIGESAPLGAQGCLVHVAGEARTAEQEEELLRRLRFAISESSGLAAEAICIVRSAI